MPPDLPPTLLSDWIRRQLTSEVLEQLCISRFGRQATGIFVMGNVCFNPAGDLLSHAQSGYGLMPAHFKEIGVKDYPRIRVVPQDHMRYWIGQEMWNRFMPENFLNNLIPAQAVLCHAIMGLFAREMWDGEHGVGAGIPFAWVYSAEPCTGKTQAMVLANMMLGGKQNGLIAGDMTKAGGLDKLDSQCSLNLYVDDVVNVDGKGLQQLARCAFDGTSRVVCGKERQPNSTVAFSVSCPSRTPHRPSPAPSSQQSSSPTCASAIHGTCNRSNIMRCVSPPRLAARQACNFSSSRSRCTARASLSRSSLSFFAQCCLV